MQIYLIKSISPNQLLYQFILKLKVMSSLQDKLSQIPQAKRTNYGKWKKTEHQRFVTGLKKYGKDWISVQKYVKTRSIVQVRSHAQKYFNNLLEQEVQFMNDRANCKGKGKYQEDSVEFQLEMRKYDILQQFCTPRFSSRLHSNKPINKIKTNDAIDSPKTALKQDILQIFYQAICQQNIQLKQKQIQNQQDNCDTEQHDNFHQQCGYRYGQNVENVENVQINGQLKIIDISKV